MSPVTVVVPTILKIFFFYDIYISKGPEVQLYILTFTLTTTRFAATTTVNCTVIFLKNTICDSVTPLAKLLRLFVKKERKKERGSGVPWQPNPNPNPNPNPKRKGFRLPGNSCFLASYHAPGSLGGLVSFSKERTPNLEPRKTRKLPNPQMEKSRQKKNYKWKLPNPE